MLEIQNKEHTRALRREASRRYREKYPERSRAATKKWQQTHKAYYVSKSREYRDRIRFEAFAAYGGKCSCCGEDTLHFLSLHHVNGNGRQHRKELKIQWGGYSFYRWLRNNNYPLGYQVLCFNCHMALSFYGICPHKTISSS